MKPRSLAIAFAALVLSLAPAALAAATAVLVPTQLTMSARTTTVSGRPVGVRVVLRDEAGEPIVGATIRLISAVTFLGRDSQEVVGEGRTDSSGKAVLTFSPATSGSAVVTARYDGDASHAAAETSMTFDVRTPVVAYQPAPVGIQAPWARSHFILVPFLGVWIAYLVVLAQARKVRRAGARAARETS